MGAYGENNDLLEKVLLELIRDHVFWRRNFHPDDEPGITTLAQHQPEYLQTVAHMKQELHRLTARLKHSVPFFHPRYIGHMSSDLLLPGLIAQLVTTLYNPNNITQEAAPVTVGMEIDVGLQLARMLGYIADERNPDCAFGHLTCGGTTANYEGLRLARAVKCWPLALRAASARCGVDVGNVVGNRGIGECDTWELFNLPVDAIIALHRRVVQPDFACLTTTARERWLRTLDEELVETLGLAAFCSRHALLAPQVLVPNTAHYSWQKGMKLLGLGTAQLKPVATAGMRMDPEALERVLNQARHDRQPVLAVVGVFGSTEFGTIDPIGEIVRIREYQRGLGLDFWLHIDAAWGGYLASMFRNEDGSLRSREDMRLGFQRFPTPAVYEAVAAIAESDSVTVDPHKLGYLPFGTGAFVCRRQGAMDFVTQDAAYVFDRGEATQEEDFRSKFSKLGQFIIEGSKPGASAAAAYVTHRVLPLDHVHFGRLPAGTLHATEQMYESLQDLASRLKDRITLVIPFEPDCNLLAIVANPVGNRDLSVANRFMRGVFEEMSVRVEVPLQAREFFGSYTSMTREGLGDAESARLLGALGLDPTSLVDEVNDSGRTADHLFVLRHTLMNPWLESVPASDGVTYVQRYLNYLETLLLRQLAQWTARHP